MNSDQIKRPRGNPTWHKGMRPANPGGRPKSGLSLADAYRAKFPPERIVELAEQLVENAESEQVRLAALQMISDRTAGKVSDKLTLSQGDNDADDGDDDLDGLDADQLRELREIRMREAALLARPANTEGSLILGLPTTID